MAVPIWVELVCDVCADSADGRWVVGGKIPVREVVKIARENGWIIRNDEVYCSRSCAKHK